MKVSITWHIEEGNLGAASYSVTTSSALTRFQVDPRSQLGRQLANNKNAKHYPQLSLFYTLLSKTNNKLKSTYTSYLYPIFLLYISII